MTVDIVPIREDLIDSFHAALDQVCRERMYFVFLKARPRSRRHVRSCVAIWPKTLRSWSPCTPTAWWADAIKARSSGPPCAIAACRASACSPTAPRPPGTRSGRETDAHGPRGGARSASAAWSRRSGTTMPARWRSIARWGSRSRDASDTRFWSMGFSTTSLSWAGCLTPSRRCLTLRAKHYDGRMPR